jgi:hypothetical protein
VQQGAALSLRVVRERLSKVAGWRRGLAAAAMGCQALALVVPQLGSVLGPMAFVCSVIACVCERVIFFKAVDALKMPGGLTA